MANDTALGEGSVRSVPTSRSPRRPSSRRGADVPDIPTLHALHELAVATGAVRDLAQFGEVVVTRARALMEVESVALFACDPPGELTWLAEASDTPWQRTPRFLDEPSVLKRLLSQRAPHLLEDYASRPDHHSETLARGLRSAAAAPLVAQDQVIGVLLARSNQPGFFDASRQQTLMLLASQVAPALEAARWHARAETQRANLELLYEVSQEVLSQADVREVARCILQRAREFTGCEVGSVEHYDPENDTTRALIVEGVPDPDRFMSTVKTARRQVMEAIADGRVQHYPDLLDSGRFRKYGEAGVRSLLVLPVAVRGEVLGILLLGKRSARSFGAEEIELLQALAHLLGVALQKEQLAAENRQAYAGLQESEARQARLAAILEATTDLVAMADREGRRIYLNRAGRRLLGLADDADVTLTTADQYRPAWAVRQRREEILPTSARDGMWQGETAYLRADGTEIPVSSVVIAHYGPDGQVEFYSTVARDLSRRQRLEAQLLQAQRLETAGRIAGQVAHDFNNLLAPLAGYPELIKLHLPPDHPAAEYCDQMLAAARRIAEINDDLLTLGRRGYFEQRPLELNPLIREALEPVLSERSRLQVVTELDPSLPLIWGSGAQLLRVLTNLLANAQEAMPHRGVLTVRSARVTIDSSSEWPSGLVPGSGVMVEVSDTGPGIPAEIQDRLFDPFFTTKTTDRKRGSGLGLSVVRSVVEDHHGRVDFRTVLGKGTTFRLVFPATEATPTDSVGDELPTGTEMILVVDDDPAQRTVVATLLRGLGYQVEEAAGGEAAVSRLTEGWVDLVILDMLMPPGIDGAETYRRIRLLHPQQRAIMLSGFAESDRVDEALALGVSAYLRKPVGLLHLAQAVRDALDTS